MKLNKLMSDDNTENISIETRKYLYSLLEKKDKKENERRKKSKIINQKTS